MKEGLEGRVRRQVDAGAFVSQIIGWTKSGFQSIKLAYQKGEDDGRKGAVIQSEEE